MSEANTSQIQVEKESIVVPLPDGPIRMPSVEATEELSDWLDEGRRSMYETLLEPGAAPVRFFAQHLPMVVSYNQTNVFPFTCGNKGVGYLPHAQYVDHFIERYRDTIEECKGKPWQESLKKRVGVASEFNLNPEFIDRRCLVTLEIFERQTFKNLSKMPLASLLFTGHSPAFTSFQVNCAVEIIGPGDPRYTFITLARTMFEYDDFHITQQNFPYAYVFWISECVSKTPFRRIGEMDDRAANRDDLELELPWDDDALAAVARAPAMIQNHIRRLVESYATERGFGTVSLGVVQEARRNLMDGR
ncbi:MAG: PCP reductase family protein [Myxococcota bacterium]|jgi:hypothetical protein|nr:PCP reductase family protein [Myxococcota bacterium]